MSVLSQVEAKLKAGGPVEQVIRLLEEYEEQIRTEQANHDALYERQTVECEDEAAYRAQEVKEATSALADGRSQLSSCEE
jgi:ABC-type microcin C transport system permease subunit YejB